MLRIGMTVIGLRKARGSIGEILGQILIVRLQFLGLILVPHRILLQPRVVRITIHHHPSPRKREGKKRGGSRRGGIVEGIAHLRSLMIRIPLIGANGGRVEGIDILRVRCWTPVIDPSEITPYMSSFLFPMFISYNSSQ